MHRLFDLKMNDNESVGKHIKYFNSIISQLYSVKIDFDDEGKIVNLHHCLDHKKM